MKPRVLLAGEFPESPPLTIGGIQAVTWQLASALANLDQFQIEVTACEKWWIRAPTRRWTRQYPGLDAHYCKSPRWLPHVASAWTTDAHEVQQCIRAFRPTLVHAHGQVGYTVGAIRSGLPHLITIHGILAVEKSAGASRKPREMLRERLWRSLEDWCLQNAHEIVVISPYVAHAIRHRTAARLHPIPNPVGSEFFGLRRELEARPSILSVGWLNSRKRHRLLIQALHRVRESIPDIRLRIVGSPPPKEPHAIENLRQFARDVGVADAVDFLGRVSHTDLLTEYGRAWVMAHAAAEESSPMAIAQAMAAGLPVVAIDIPGIRHLVDAETGARVGSATPDALAGALASCLADANLRARMGERARATAECSFSSEAVARTTADVYNLILGDSPLRKVHS
jgi:glycosyltransferase involved in cell wall biosynthesis